MHGCHRQLDRDGNSSSSSASIFHACMGTSFKNRLDKFWANEEARFDYKANLSGSGFTKDASKSYVAFLLLCTIV